MKTFDHGNWKMLVLQQNLALSKRLPIKIVLYKAALVAVRMEKQNGFQWNGYSFGFNDPHRNYKQLSGVQRPHNYRLEGFLN